MCAEHSGVYPLKTMRCRCVDRAQVRHYRPRTLAVVSEWKALMLDGHEANSFEEPLLVEHYQNVAGGHNGHGGMRLPVSPTPRSPARAVVPPECVTHEMLLGWVQLPALTFHMQLLCPGRSCTKPHCTWDGCRCLFAFLHVLVQH